LLFLLGLLTLVGLIWHIGPLRILDAASGVGPLPLLVILLPSVLMYALEAYGWRLTLGQPGAGIGFSRLFAIRTAGEVVNMTTPIAYVGGEPLKAYLLKRHGVPMVEGMASVVTAKTTMTIAQVAFILAGIVIGVRILGVPASPANGRLPIPALWVGVVLLAGAAAALLLVQRQGLFTGVLNLLRRLRFHIRYLEAREDQLRALDQAILDFYARGRRRFLFSTGVFFLGWMAEALEVFVIIACLGVPVTLPAAVSIGALSVFIKGGTFFIPGSLGAQEAGNVLLLLAFGYSDLDGITFALLRRFRELVWIAIGLACLAALGGAKAAALE
jgi:uncharacterized protein (TIRG00374 family)